MEVAVEDERLGAALALVELEQLFEGERIAVEAARDPERFHVQGSGLGERRRPVPV